MSESDAEVEVPTPPPGLGTAAIAAWQHLHTEYTFEAHHLPLVARYCRTVDRLEALDAILARDGLDADGRLHWAAVEARLLGESLGRLLATLRLPEAEDEDGEDQRQQRRGGHRQPYGLRSVSA